MLLLKLAALAEQDVLAILKLLSLDERNMVGNAAGQLHLKNDRFSATITRNEKFFDMVITDEQVMEAKIEKLLTWFETRN